QAAEVCAEEADRFRIGGFELAPWYAARLRGALEGTGVPGRTARRVALHGLGRQRPVAWLPARRRGGALRPPPRRCLRLRAANAEAAGRQRRHLARTPRPVPRWPPAAAPRGRRRAAAPRPGRGRPPRRM